MNKMYHVYSEGDNVLFRGDSDYTFFNNKFASSTFLYRLSPLAETTMSTHYHSLLEPADESAILDFKKKIKKSYSLYYENKYGKTLEDEFKIESLEIVGIDSIIQELIYIMKNPVHHYVTSYPFEYPYSSAPFLFMDRLMPPQIIESFMSRTVAFKDVSTRKRKQIVGRDTIPDNWRVTESGLILPSSYINQQRARAFWNNNVKSFMFDINKNQTDAKKETIQADILDLRTSGKNDIEVCKIVDDFATQAGKQSFHLLEPKELTAVIRSLKMKGISKNQIARCLWLKE
jgi:hypothetical protein